MSKDERSGWRDQQISDRHRTWGMNVPAVDIDFLLIEYDSGQPKAAIDYKYGIRNINLQSPNYVALSSLFNQSGENLPFFIVCYDKNPWKFEVSPVNETANAMCNRLELPVNKIISEYDYVNFLYRIRERKMPSYVHKSLKEQK